VTYKKTTKSLNSASGTEMAPYLLECSAFSLFKQTNRDEEAAQQLMRAIHLSPNNLEYW
jgi:hypothetical protein